MDATDSLRFRAAPNPVAAGAKSDGSRADMLAIDAHMDSVARLRARPFPAGSRPVRTESGMRQTRFGMICMRIGGTGLGHRPSERGSTCTAVVVEPVRPRCAMLPTRCRYRGDGARPAERGANRSRYGKRWSGQ